MSYSINGTDLSTLGILPSKGNSSLISVNGIYDFPSRKGQTERDWGIEVEPFVSAADIEFESKDIIFDFLITSSNYTQLYSRIDSFSALCKTGLLNFVTDYGTVTVVLKKTIDIKVINSNLATGKATFTQQEVSFVSLTKVATGGSGWLLAGYNLQNDFGIYVSSCSGLESTQKRLEVNTTDNYNQAAYRELKEISISSLIIQSNFSEFKSNIDQFHALLASPGMKTLTDENGRTFSVYVKEGFNVSIKSTSDVIGTFTLKLRAV